MMFEGFLRPAMHALAAFGLPGLCRICGSFLARATSLPVCPKCLASLQPLAIPVCTCGRPFPSPAASSAIQLRCHLCRKGVYAFDLARSFGVYDGVMVQAIVLLKHHGVTTIAGWFAARLAEMVSRNRDLMSADIIVPVPLDESRRRERGYNQAELIARMLARRLNMPLQPEILARIKARPKKLKLTRRERWQTVRGAYVTREGSRIDKQRVLLIDDVFTTGATLDSCTRALKKAGATRVTAVTVARVVPGWISPTSVQASKG